MIKFNTFRIKLDTAIDYVPIASAINSIIDLIQKRIFAHKPQNPQKPLSAYQKHILGKTKKECLLNMIPLAKIIQRARYEGNAEDSNSSTQEESSNSFVMTPEEHEEALSQPSDTNGYLSSSDSQPETLKYTPRVSLNDNRGSSSSDTPPEAPETPRESFNIDNYLSSSSIEELPEWIFTQSFTNTEEIPVNNTSQNSNVEFNEEKLLELRSMSIAQLIEYLSIENDEGRTPLDSPDSLIALLPFLLDVLSTKDLRSVLYKNNSNWQSFSKNYSINEDIINSLSKSQCLRFTALVTSVAIDVLAHERSPIFNLTVKELMREWYKILPPFAVSYSELLIPNNIKSKYDRIIFIPKIEGLTDEESYDALAHLIELKKANLKSVFILEPNPGLILLKLAPHLRYLDLTEFNDIDLANRILKSCSKLNHLRISDGNVLKDIESLPELQIFNCSDCENLTELSVKMPKLKTLYSFSNSSLIAIRSEMPLIEEIKTYDCPHLVSLPSAMPLLIDLDCSDCAELTTLPAALPRCQRLDYSLCPITEVPQVPFDAVVICENAVEFSTLRVDFEKFTTAPMELLNSLAYFLLNNQPFPNVHYYENGVRNNVIDAGGVRRDFVTRICENLFKRNIPEEMQGKFLNMDDNSKPQTLPKVINEQKAYRTLGALLAICAADGSNFKTGPLLNVEVYQLLCAPYKPGSDEWFLHNALQLRCSPAIVTSIVCADGKLPTFTSNELASLSYVITPEDGVEITQDYVQTNRIAIREELLEQAKKDMALQAISWIAEAIKMKVSDERWNQIIAQSPSDLKDQFEGILSVQALKSRLQWEFTDEVTAEDRTKIQRFLNTWINTNQSLDRLSLFVRAVTGNKTLSSTHLVLDVDSRGRGFMPKAQTCFYTLKLSLDCESQDTFNESLEELLLQTQLSVGFSDN